jgi:hypothetical protein
LQPVGGIFEAGFEVGGKRWYFDGGLILGAGGLEIDTDRAAAQSDLGDAVYALENPMILGGRGGISYSLHGHKWRLNTGGGIVVLGIRGSKKDETKQDDSSSSSSSDSEYETADILVGPYTQIKFDLVVLDTGGGFGWTVFAGYRCEFLPGDKFDAYFTERKKFAAGPFKMRDAIIAGIGILL